MVLFDAHDADFFLELLPGPRDRNGLPESLRFWKTRIEEFDPDKTFKVGLIYGPSGCGKSSLVKAGLLPRLSENVLQVYVEATADGTEVRLLRGLRKACPVPTDRDLIASLAVLRRGGVLSSGRKVLVVIDQFEQWLHAKRNEEDSGTRVAALRQCDGEHVQAVVLVRDDFLMAATQFMERPGDRPVPGRNVALPPIFSICGTPVRSRLAFGQAYGTLPERIGALTGAQNEFLDKSVGGLAEDGKVISVRLALFAEMIKGKPWTPTTLKDVDEPKGVGVIFLEETFGLTAGESEVSPSQKGSIPAVLNSLLPGDRRRH